jgi:ferritin heavy chain
MFLRPISASSLSPMRGINSHSHSDRTHRSSFLMYPATITALSSSFSNHAFSSLSFGQRKCDKTIVSASNKIVNTPLSGMVFLPFEELKNDAFVVPVAPQVSLARQSYSDECETAINEQIK